MVCFNLLRLGFEVNIYFENKGWILFLGVCLFIFKNVLILGGFFGGVLL